MHAGCYCKTVFRNLKKVAFIVALQSTISIAGYMKVWGKIDMLTHINSLIKNVLDKKHHIEAVVCSFRAITH